MAPRACVSAPLCAYVFLCGSCVCVRMFVLVNHTLLVCIKLYLNTLECQNGNGMSACM
jgi:hypothetical protein